MSKACPDCSSSQTIPIQTCTEACTVIGAVTGVAFSAYALSQKSSSSFLSVAKAPGTVFTCISAGKSGAAFGEKVGREIDSKFFPRYQCKNCLNTFPSILSLF